jgi:uncharacterized protein YciI
MSEITDAFMTAMLSKVRLYSLVLLGRGPNYDMDGARAIIWEHGRRNFELRAAGKLVIVGPMDGDGDPRGLCIFTADVKETGRIMAEDPAVRAGILTVTIHAMRSFPGDGLPE